MVNGMAAGLATSSCWCVSSVIEQKDCGRVSYYNFDIAIDQTEDGYFVRVTDSPAGTTIEAFVLPLLATEVQQMRTLAYREPAEAATPGAPQSQDVLQTLQEFGQRLFLALFPKSVRALLQSSYRMAYEQRTRLRIRLQLELAPQLQALPWEYLFDPMRGEYLALSLHTPLARYTNLMHRIPPLGMKGPLRMLVVIACPAGYPSFDAGGVWLRLLDSLDYLAPAEKLFVEQLRKPTLFDLQRRLRQNDCHIVHFIGYGAYDEYTSDGILILEDEMGRSRPISGQHLGALLRDHSTVRLALLQAVDRQISPRTTPFLAAAQSLIQRGLPAAVAVQAPLGENTLIFTQNFYDRIVDYSPVDEAITEARRAMETYLPGSAWGIPALTMRTPDGLLFAPAPPPVVRRKPSGFRIV